MNEKRFPALMLLVTHLLLLPGSNANANAELPLFRKITLFMVAWIVPNTTEIQYVTNMELTVLNTILNQFGTNIVQGASM